jgi:hypothetical protein
MSKAYFDINHSFHLSSVNINPMASAADEAFELAKISDKLGHYIFD